MTLTSDYELEDALHNARSEERKKVLGELESEINRVSLTGFTKYTYRKWVLEALRQKAGKGDQK
jgi:hypothetical protein